MREPRSGSRSVSGKDVRDRGTAAGGAALPAGTQRCGGRKRTEPFLRLQRHLLPLQLGTEQRHRELTARPGLAPSAGKCSLCPACPVGFKACGVLQVPRSPQHGGQSILKCGPMVQGPHLPQPHPHTPTFPRGAECPLHEPCCPERSWASLSR